jgi:two-component system KDP operon response regulator KdpE
MKILIIEDNAEIVETISLALQIRWHEVELISTVLGEEGVGLVESEAPDAVILDLGLPDMGGFQVLKEIRLFSNVPIIILTVRAEESDIVKGLEWGADDYIVKPFRQMELLARLKGVVRRQGPQQDVSLVAGQLRLNPTIHELVKGDKKINLTATEARILHSLMKSAGYVVTHARLAEAVWGTDYTGAADSLKVYIHRLREKLETDPSNPKLILSKPNVGYFLVKSEGK